MPLKGPEQPGESPAADVRPRCGGCGGSDFTSSFAYTGVAGSGYLVHCAGCGRAIGFIPHVLTRIEQEIMERIERERLGSEGG